MIILSVKTRNKIGVNTYSECFSSASDSLVFINKKLFILWKLLKTLGGPIS